MREYVFSGCFIKPRKVIMSSTTTNEVVWKRIETTPGKVGQLGSIVLQNNETHEKRDVPIVELRSAGTPGFTLQHSYALGHDDVFYAVR